LSVFCLVVQDNLKKIFKMTILVYRIVKKIQVVIILKHRVNIQILLNNNIALNDIKYMSGSKSIYNYNMEMIDDKHIINSVVYYNDDINDNDILDVYSATSKDVQKIIYQTNVQKYDWKIHCHGLLPDIKNIVNEYLGYAELEGLVYNYHIDIKLVKLVNMPMIFIDQSDMIGYKILTCLIQSYNDDIYTMIDYINKFIINKYLNTHENPSSIISCGLYKHMRSGYKTSRL
jgi:hypothetical protein